MDGIDADAGADDASRRYYFLHRPAHLDAAGDRAALDAILQDPAWLKAKLDATGSPQDLVADYDQFAQGEVQDLIGRTLRLTSGICARDKHQLMPQLYGRLMPESAAADFSAAAQKFIVPPAIATWRSSLTPPGPELMRLEGHGGPVNALALLPDGLLASGSDDKTIRLWDLNTRQETARLHGHRAGVTALAVLLDNRLASGSIYGIIRLWDTKTGVETAQLEGGYGDVNALALLPDGRLASGVALGVVQLWDVKTCCQTAMLKVRGIVKALAVLPDGRLASASVDGKISLWDPTTDQELARFEGHKRDVGALTVVPDDCFVSSGDGSI